MQKEMRKAALLDELMQDLQPCFNEWNNEHTYDMVMEAKRKYDELMDEKPLSKDPYADEVFGGSCGSRIVTAAVHYLGLRPETAIARKDLRLSHMPTLGWFAQTRQIGKKSLWLYEETMRDYGFHDKL